jgi:hypothetical protein
MSGTEGPKNQTARALLLSWALWLPVRSATAAALTPAALQPASTFTALQARLDLTGLGRDVLAGLEGRPAASWEELDARLRGVEAWLAIGSMLPEEQAGLTSEVARLRRVIDGARALRADPARTAELSALLASAPKTDRLARAAALLSRAAQDPAAAARIFDASSSRSAAVAAGGRSATAADPKAPLKPRLKATDLLLTVPAPGGQTPVAPQKRSAPNSAVFVSAHVAKLTDPSGNASFEVGVADLLRQGGAASRTELSRRIAGEALAALGLADKDGARAKALANFLRDIAEYRPADAVAAHLSMDGKNHFRLIFERANRSRRILLGQFLPGTTQDGKPGPAAFIVMGTIEMSAGGEPRQEHPGYWREYTGDDRRLEWGARTRTEKKGWGPWSREDQLQDVTLSESVWREGRWQSRGARDVKTIAAKEGKSWLGRTADKVMETPVLGDTLKFCDDTAATIYTGLVGAPQVFIAAATRSDTYSLEAGGSYAKNPLMNRIVGDQGHIDRLTPGARQELYARVREERRRAVASQAFPVAPEQARQIIDAPIDAEEAAAALRGGYGASTYGKRLMKEGAETPGWKGAALTAGGVALGVVEGVSEGVCNPILWATLGLGHAATAVKGGAAVAEGAAGATAGLYALQGAHAVATALWWGPWLFSMTDNAGRLVETTAQGKFDKDYFQRVSEGGADAVYLFILP